MAQQFAFYGLASNLIMYLTNVLDQPLATAAKNVNTWLGVSSIFPVLGAFVADSYLGRFTTILFSITIYFMVNKNKFIIISLLHIFKYMCVGCFCEYVNQIYSLTT